VSDKIETMNPSSQQFTVLAVDDSPIYRKLVERSLSGERYSLLFAKNGRAALDLFAEHQPAVVITDWDMPDIGDWNYAGAYVATSKNFILTSSCLRPIPTKRKSLRGLLPEPTTT